MPKRMPHTVLKFIHSHRDFLSPSRWVWKRRLLKSRLISPLCKTPSTDTSCFPAFFQTPSPLSGHPRRPFQAILLARKDLKGLFRLTLCPLPDYLKSIIFFFRQTNKGHCQASHLFGFFHDQAPGVVTPDVFSLSVPLWPFRKRSCARWTDARFECFLPDFFPDRGPRLVIWEPSRFLKTLCFPPSP